MAPRSIAIIGVGFSGTTLALQLLRHGPDRLAVHLIERTGRFGAGLAYGTDHDGHLLNVPAGRMSAFADRENDFLDWLRARSGPDVAAGTFASRRTYGCYLHERLADAAARDGAGRLNLVHDAVVGIEDRHSAVLLVGLM